MRYLDPAASVLGGVRDGRVVAGRRPARSSALAIGVVAFGDRDVGRTGRAAAANDAPAEAPASAVR